jgi:hypothetical protein
MRQHPMENTNYSKYLTSAPPEQVAAIRAAVIAVIDVDCVNEVSADYYGIPIPLAAAREHAGVSIYAAMRDRRGRGRRRCPGSGWR